MALEDCIKKALKALAINQKEAEKIRKFATGREMSDEAIVETFIKEAIQAKRRAQLQVIATKRNMANIKAHPQGIGRGVEGILMRDLQGKTPFSNVDYRRHAILAEFHGRLSEAMSAYRTKKLGFTQDVAGMRKMIKEIFGESTGDVDAARFAGMWRDVAEGARMRYNVAGGAIPRRKDWGLPHAHDVRKIAGVPFNEWADFIVPRLDRSRMFNKHGLKISAKEFDELISSLYGQFVSESGITAQNIARSIPNKPDSRLLTFKNSHAWMEYNERFGNPDLYHSMMTHLENLASDTALLEILGPEPNAAIRGFTAMAAKDGYPNFTIGGHGIKVIKASYEVLTGGVNQTDAKFIADLGRSTRNLLSSAQLGSAFVASFTDLATIRMTAKFNGMPQVKFFSTLLSQMNPANEADRIFAVQLGLGAEAWITRALSASRFQEITGTDWTARISDLVFRATLLSPWTDAGRKAFGMEFLGFVGQQVNKRFSDLPGMLRDNFARYGITERQWEILRRTPLIERDGAKYLRPMDVTTLSREQIVQLGGVFKEAASEIEAEMKLRGSRAGALVRRLQAKDVKASKLVEAIQQIEDASNRLQEMVLTEMDFAVPMPDARIRALATGGKRRGSFSGELWRSVAMYKQFPITIVATHLYRGARGIDGLGKGKYLAELILSMTIMGAIAVQSKHISKGKFPQDMTDPKFWAQAFAQGGGAGIYGDFIQASESRFGKGITSTLAGPVFGFIDDITKLTLGNLHQVLAGKEANFMRDTINFAKRYTPGSSAWYARLALERLFWDRLLEAGDPKAHQTFRRTIRRAQRNYGQEFWWKPGSRRPGRSTPSR